MALSLTHLGNWLTDPRPNAATLARQRTLASALGADN